MRIRLSEFKKIINKFLSETLEEMQEDHTSHSAESGYSAEIEEDVDRLRRAKDGYGETEFEEAVTPPSAPQSSKIKVKDKSKMQGVGPRPTMANAFSSLNKKEGVDDPPQEYDDSEVRVDKLTKGNADHPIARSIERHFDRQNVKNKGPSKFLNKKEAAVGSVDPRLKPQAAASSAALHTRDKSQMQGVGPRPTMATAFGDQGQQKKEEEEPFNPNKTNVLDKDFVHPGAKERQQIKQGRQDQIKQISHQQQAQMQSQGWKFDRQPDGNWYATPPAKHESKKNKKR